MCAHLADWFFENWDKFFLVFFTWRLVVFNKSLANSTTKLWNEAYDAGKTAKISADAAKISADAAIQTAQVTEKALFVAERAYLFFDKVIDKGFTTNVYGANASQTKFIYSDGLKYSVRNNGRTPAVLREIYHQIEIFDNSGDSTKRQAIKPNSVKPGSTAGKLIPSGVSIAAGATFDELECTFPYPADTSGAGDSSVFSGIANGQKCLFLTGYIRYVDIFNKNHILGFCYNYNFNEEKFYIFGDDEYNYMQTLPDA
jgi:hypothetical protein